MQNLINKSWRLTPDVIFQPDHLKNDLAGKSVRGGMTTMVWQIAQFLLTLLSTVVLARVLLPDDYGLVGMVAVITGFATMFKNAGLSIATIQSEQITHPQISNLFWVNLGVSVFIGLLLIASAPLIANFYGRSELIGITIFLAISFILGGFTIQHQALLYRHMRFGILTAVSMASQLVGVLVSFGIAWSGGRYWSLVGASVASAVISIVLTYSVCPWFPGPVQKNTGARKLLAFGGHLTLSNVANYFATNLDNVIVCTYMGVEALGLYDKAYQLFLLPIRQLKETLQNTILPALSSLNTQPERYRKYYQRFLDLLATLTIPIALYCLVEADFIVHIFLGEQWTGAIPVFRVFAMAGLIYPLTGTIGLVLVSLGKTKHFSIWTVANAALSVGSFIIGAKYGIVGVAGAFTLMNYLFLLPSLIYGFHKTPIGLFLFFKTISIPLLTGFIATAGALFIKLGGQGDSLLKHMLLGCIFAGSYIGLSYLRKSFRETSFLVLKYLSGVKR